MSDALQSIDRLDGRFAVLAMTRLLREGQPDVQAIQTVYGMAMPRILRKGESAGKTGEELADLAIGSLEYISENAAYSQHVLQILPVIRKHLENDPVSIRGDGWIKSLGTIGMLASRCATAVGTTEDATREATIAGIYYYHDALWHVGNDAKRYADADTIEAAANNLSAGLRRLAELAKGDPEKLRPIVPRLARIARGAAILRGGGRPVPAEIFQRLGYDFGSNADPRALST